MAVLEVFIIHFIKYKTWKKLILNKLEKKVLNILLENYFWMFQKNVYDTDMIFRDK
jgi:hypothetical protein